MKHPGCKKPGRQELRWNNCEKRDVRKAVEDDKWREKAAHRENLKGIKQLGCCIHKVALPL